MNKILIALVTAGLLLTGCDSRDSGKSIPVKNGSVDIKIAGGDSIAVVDSVGDTISVVDSVEEAADVVGDLDTQTPTEVDERNEVVNERLPETIASPSASGIKARGEVVAVGDSIPFCVFALTEDGEPVPGARVQIVDTFGNPFNSSNLPQAQAAEASPERGLTDENGFFYGYLSASETGFYALSAEIDGRQLSSVEQNTGVLYLTFKVYEDEIVEEWNSMFPGANTPFPPGECSEANRG